MSVDYSKAILTRYEFLKREARLSPNLVNPTTANLRNECKRLCGERILRKDEPVLRTFFNLTGPNINYMHAIDQFDTDRFRPIVKLLKEGYKRAQYINFEMIAWLIDFEPRPYDPKVDYRLVNNEPVGEVVNLQKPSEDFNSDPVHTPINAHDDLVTLTTTKEIENSPTEEFGTPATYKIIAIIFSIIVVVLSGYFLTKQTSATLSSRMGPQLCMYWTIDHYERANCNEKLKGTQLVAYDSALLHGFRLVTKPDTVTAYSLGKMWYLKRNKRYDLFTAPGIHPIHHDTLHPLTMYIINRIGEQQAAK